MLANLTTPDGLIHIIKKSTISIIYYYFERNYIFPIILNIDADGRKEISSILVVGEF